MATWTKVVTESSSGEIGQNAASATVAAAITSAGTLTFTGDVTGGTTPTYTSGGNLSIAMTIADNSVDGTDIALGSDASGDIMYYSAGGDYVRLAKGSDGQVLKLASGLPSWAADTDTGDVNQNAWSTITVPTGTTSQAADTATDTLAFTAAGGMTITGAADDSIQFSSTDTQLSTTQVTAKVLTNLASGTGGNIAAGDTMLAAFEKLETRTAVNDAKATNTDVSVTEPNLRSTLASITENVTIGDGTDVWSTFAGNVSVTGDLLVSGTQTYLNTATLQVEDKLIKLADVTTPSKATANGAGIQIESNSVHENDWPELKWAQDQGGGHTTGAGTANGLTGWTISNMQTSNQVDIPIAVMEFSTNSTAPTGIAGGVGSFHYDSGDDELYIRTI